jgi:DNA polymerase V
MLKVTSIRPFSGETSLELPLFYPKVAAGFPSPAEYYFEERLDLNKTFIRHPAATFCVKVEGDSMIDAGIFSGDVLIVDRSISPKHGDIVIAALNGDLTVKRLDKGKHKLRLSPENPDYRPIDVGEETDLIVWGVATYNIHPLSGAT